MSEPYTGPSVFASTFTYPYTKLRGTKWVIEALNAGEGFPAAETVAELKGAVEGNFTVYQDGGTLITKGRSVAAGEFLRSTADVWLSFDDDAFVPRRTLHALVETCRATRALVGAPALNRLSNKPNYNTMAPWNTARVVEMAACKLYPVDVVSFTCVAIHRRAVESLAWPETWLHNEREQKPYPALFLERTYQGQWVGEDAAFCMRMRESFLQCFLLLEHSMVHAGVGCTVDENGVVSVDRATAERLQSEHDAK